MKRITFVATAALLLTTSFAVRAGDKVEILAAENFYGDIAKQIGGDHVRVTNVLSSPDQDPHLFEASPSVAKAVHDARIVLYNGAGYDPWLQKMVAASKSNNRVTLAAADLVGAKDGDNPHLWYNPRTMPAVAKAFARALSEADPAHKSDYAQGLQRLDAELKPLAQRVSQLRQRFEGTPVAATEPVFGYMFEALGMMVSNPGFQMSVMNDTEPTASQVASLEQDLKQRRIALFVYNSQATDPMAERMLGLAKRSHVPVISVTETKPKGMSYQQWMLSELSELEKALSESRQ